MIEFEEIETILWDFDGVILDSMAVREEGFRTVLSNYSKPQVEKLLKYHKNNAGLSRYVKFRYFITEVLGKDINQEMVQDFARAYSQIMRRKLIFKKLLNPEVLAFLDRKQDSFNMHIVSGSDGEELRFLCGKLGIKKYFKSIEGSPTPKTKLVSKIVDEYGYSVKKTCLIGDSINDYEAAKENQVIFYGYNSKSLKEKKLNYIESFAIE